MEKTLQKGFTLVELLVVMGILAILMAAVVVGIDPLDKLNAAGDAKAQQDIGTIARGMEAYAAGHAGSYPCNGSTLLTADFTMSGELKAIPTAPSGRSYFFPGCSATEGRIWAEVKSKKFTSDTKAPGYPCGGVVCTGSVYWAWCSSTGAAGAKTVTNACP